MLSLFLLTVLSSLSSATLLVDYTPTSPASSLGEVQLETSDGNFVSPSSAGTDAYIKPDTDPNGKPCLHYHREPSYERAEVKAKGAYAAGKNYFVGYEFALGAVHEHLSIFQWKKSDKTASPLQNIPFNLIFTSAAPTRLSITYQPPGQGSNPDSANQHETIWTSSATTDFALSPQTHHVALAFDTKAGGNNKLQMWLDGTSVFEKEGLSLWTGATYPKFGLYRGEKGDHDGGGYGNTFDEYVYRVQISDEGMDEIGASSGLIGGGAAAAAVKGNATTVAVERAFRA